MKANFAIGAITSVLISAGLSGCAETSQEETQTQIETPAVTPAVAGQASERRSLEQITPTLYVFRNNNHVALVILTDEGTVLVDPINAGAAAWVNNEVTTRFGKAITHVIYAHAHHDHASGAAVLGVPIIAHENAVAASTAGPGQKITGPNLRLDVNGDNAISRAEADDGLLVRFDAGDTNGDNILTAQEWFTDLHRNVKAPDQTYSGAVERLNLGGRAIELHHVPNNHTEDLSYIFVPDEKLLFIVDVHSMGALPFGDLPWYGHEDWRATIDKALSFDADIVASGHGKVGTMADVRELDAYMSALRAGVQDGINKGHSLEQIKANVTLPQYSHMEFFERVSDNIDGMYRVLTAGT